MLRHNLTYAHDIYRLSFLDLIVYILSDDFSCEGCYGQPTAHITVTQLQYFLATQSRVMTMEGVRPCVGEREMRNEQEEV